MPVPTFSLNSPFSRLRDAAGELDHLDAAPDLALGIGERLAVLGGDQIGQLVDVLLEQLLEPEHDARAPQRGDRRPFGQRPPLRPCTARRLAALARPRPDCSPTEGLKISPAAPLVPAPPCPLISVDLLPPPLSIPFPSPCSSASPPPLLPLSPLSPPRITPTPNLPHPTQFDGQRDASDPPTEGLEDVPHPALAPPPPLLFPDFPPLLPLRSRSVLLSAGLLLTRGRPPRSLAFPRARSPESCSSYRWSADITCTPSAQRERQVYAVVDRMPQIG